MSKQIDLLFGVKGGGSVSGTSGQRIKSQLDSITGQINKTPFKIIFEANTDAIKAAQDQINALKESIAAIPPITVNSNADKDASGTDKQVNSYKTAQKELGALLILQEKMKDSKVYNESLPSVQKLRTMASELTALSQSFAGVDGTILSEKNLDETALRDLEAFVEKFQALNPQIEIAKEATKQYNNTLKETAATAKKASTEQLSSQKILNQAWSSYSKFTNIKDYPELNSSYLNLIERLNNTTNLTAEDSREFTKELKHLENQAYKAGVAADTLGEAIDKKIGDRLKYLVGQFAINFITQGLRMIYNNVVQIDSAMTELKKVTDATSQEYERFLSNASVRAKELGATLVEVINATADYARLGYSISEASDLADSAIVYQNVGDGLSGIDEATQHLISTMTAFGVAAENSMHIVDIFNEVANNYAVSASDIGTGLQKSGAAMKAAGNSLEETVAIFTAANTIQQDADVVGTALKTMSMRLRSTKSDMEAAGEDTEGMAESVSTLRKEILALTGVDIQIDDNTYKSSYQMLQDLSAVWSKLDDLTRANVLELLFGKRQASIGAGLLENFDIAEKALETALDSSGSAMKENAVYLESIQGHLDQLTASWQTFSANVLDSDVVKFGVDFLKGIVDLLNALVENFGALGVVLDGLAIASFVDMFAGFKHIKDIVGGIDKLINVKKMHDLASVVAKLSETPNIKISGSVQGELLEYSKLYDKLKQIADKLKSIPTLLQGAGASVTEMSSAMATGIGATIGAIGLIVTGWTIAGIIDEQTHKVEAQLKKLTEAQEAYNSEVSGLEELNSELQKNKERLKELESIKTPSIVEQEEIERLKTENDLLEKQIELQQKLVDLKQREYYEQAVDTFSNTYGITEYDSSARGLQYYSQAQGERFQRIISDVTAKLDKAREQGNEKNIAIFEEQLLKYETLYAEWQQDVINLRGELSGAEGDKYSEVVRALDDIMNWWNGESSPFTNILNDSRFTGILDALKSGGVSSFKDLEQLDIDSESIDAFSRALNDADYSLEDVIDALNRTEDASHIAFTIDTSELDSARDNVKNLTSSISSMSSAFAEQAENGQLSVDTIFEVMEAGYASALVIDQSTGAVTLNKEAYAALAQAEVIEQMAKLQGIKASYEQQIANLNEAETTDAVTGAVRRLTAAEIQENAVKLRGYITDIDAQLAILSQIDMSKVTAGLYSLSSAASSAKSAISNLQSGMKTLLSQTMSWLKQQYDDSKEASENYYNSQIDSLKDAQDAAKDRWDAEKDAIEEQKDAYDDLIDAQLELLRREKEADEYAKNRNSKAKEVSDIENQLLAIANDDSIEAQKMRLELQEKLAEAQDELNELQADREYDLREQALEDEKDRFDDEIQAKLDAIDKMAEAEDNAYQQRIDQLQKYLDAVQSATISEAQIREEAYDWIENRTEELYQNLLKYNYEYGDGLTSTVEGWFADAEGWQAWGDTFEEALNNIAKYLREVEDGAGGIVTTTQEAMNELLEILTEWQQQLIAEGDETGAQIIANFMKILSTASMLGLDLTENMVSTIKDIAADGNTALLEMTGKCIQYFNGLAASGVESVDELWQGFQRFFTNSSIGTSQCIEIISKALDEGDEMAIRYFSDLGNSMLKAEADGKEFSKQMSRHITDIANQLWEMRGSMSDEAFSRMWQNFCNDVAIADNALYVHGQNMVNNYAAIANAAQATATIMSQITTANGQTQTSISAKNDVGNAPLHQYASGGVVDYTGPAQVHGSKANPEVVFNADAAAKLYEYVVSTPNLLKAAFEGAVGNVSVKNVGQPNTSASIGDIILNINGNADGATVAELKKAASALKEEIVKSLNESMNRRGIMRSPRTI